MLMHRVALVTGASRGIGAATACLLAENGAAVAVNYLQNEKAAYEVVQKIGKSKGKALAVQADVTDAAQVEQMIERVQSTLGPIDTLVLNASIAFRPTPFVELGWEDFGEKLLGEMAAAFHCCKAVVPSMIEHRRGCIIAMSTNLSRHPGDGFSAHSASKAALDTFMKSLSYELGPFGIRVNTVAPGTVLTDATAWLPDKQKELLARRTPLRRNATPEDIAGVVLFLASDLSAYVTGSYLPVDGGSQTP